MTTFAKWLEGRGETAWRYAASRGYNKETIRGLAGIPSSRIPSFYTTRLLGEVSEETGIPIGTLHDEALKGAGQIGRYVRQDARND